VDTNLLLEREVNSAGKRTDRLMLRYKKQKDAREFDPIPLRLAAVDEDEGSCVIEPRVAVGAEEDWPTSSPKTARTDQRALEALTKFAGADVSFTAWWAASELPKSTFNNATKRLLLGMQIEKTPQGNYRLVQVQDGPTCTNSNLDKV